MWERLGVLGPGIENETGQGRIREKQSSVSFLSAAAYEHSGMDGDGLNMFVLLLMKLLTQTKGCTNF